MPHSAGRFDPRSLPPRAGVLTPPGERIRSSRRRPRRFNFDYLHLRALLEALEPALADAVAPGDFVLDVYCGTRPYDHLLPPGARCIGLDVDDHFGVADVVTRAFLPFEDGCFDAVMSIEAFHYVADPQAGVGELRRVLRPGGRVVIAVPLVWEYDRNTLEHRYTAQSLAALFDGWEEVHVRENGGRAVAWATMSGRMVDIARERLSTKFGRARLWNALAGGFYGILNFVAASLEPRFDRDSERYALPMNLLLTARRSVDE